MNSGLISSHRFFWMGLLVMANLAVFWRVHEFEFLNYDDQAYVSQNPFIRGGLTADGILWAFSAGLLFPSTNVDYWQPATFLSRMLDIELFGFDPAMHHLVNLGFHILNTLLLFHIWFRMTGRVERSFWLAALFAIHPLHVEPVVWVTERKDVLCCMFWLLTMWAYLRQVAQPHWTRYALVAGLFACALMSKAMAVTLPCVLLLLDFWPLRRANLDRASIEKWKQLVLEKLPLLALSLAMGLLTIRSQFSHVRPHSFFITISNALVSYATYLVKTIWPVGLAIHYPHPGASLTLSQIGGAAFLLVLISIWAVRNWREASHRVVGWCWFLGTLTPVITLNDIGGADRFTYLPLVGVFVMVIWEIAGWAESRADRHVPLRIFATAAIAGFMVTSWVQTGHWRNSETMTRHSLEVAPNDWVARHQMGIMLLDGGEIDRGMAELIESLRLNPDFGYAHYNLGIALMRKKKIREAIPHFESALRTNPTFFDAHCNIGDACLLLGHVDEAARHYFRALQVNPGFGPAHHHLALCLAHHGYFLQAEKHLRMALHTNIDPGEAGLIREELKQVHKRPCGSWSR